MKHKTILTVISVIVLASGITIYYSVQNNSNQTTSPQLEVNTNTVEETNSSNQQSSPNNIYSFSYESTDDIYNLNNQNATYEQIKSLKEKNNYTVEKPLLIKNPYGTNTTSLYVYFESSVETYAKYTIHTPNMELEDYSHILYNGKTDNLTTNHEYQLIGFIPSTDNEVTIELYDAKDQLIEANTFIIPMDSLDSRASLTLKKTTGVSSTSLSEGLYFIFGNDAKNPEAPDNILLYDNNGILRGEIPLLSYRSDKVEMVGENLLYSYGFSNLCLVDRLGRIVNTYDIGIYKQHHDFIYIGNDTVLILTTDSTRDSKEDIVLTLNLSTKEYDVLIDFRELMYDEYIKSTLPSDKKILDWLHFNTIQIINNDSLILSSRELSTIIKVDNIFSTPAIGYLIADKSIWEDSNYKSKLLTKIGDFVSQAGQHTVTFVDDNSLPEGQYYLHLFNNNFGAMYTRPSYDWSNIPGVGKKGDKAEYSMYYRYLIDEVKGTYELVKEVKVPYSSIVSSTQEYGGNIITNSGWSNVYNEYDNEGQLIAEFSYENKTYTYRVFKYNLNNFWFNYKEINTNEQ